MISVAKLTKLLSWHRIDVALCYFVKPVIFGVLAARIAGVKRRVALLEGLGLAFTKRPPATPTSYKLTLIKWVQIGLYRVTLPLAHRLIVLNNGDINTLKRYVKLPSVSILGGIGVPKTFFRLTKPLCNPLAFIFIGRLLKNKGIREFIAAAQSVKKRYPFVRFIVVGDIDAGNPLSLSTDLSQLKERFAAEIEFVGPVKNVTPYLKQASVLVLPSYREGFSRVVQEAMAMGRPVIVSDVPGCRDAINQDPMRGVNGLLVPPFSPEAIAEKMSYLIENPDKLISMGEAAYHYAVAHFDGVTVSKRLAGLLLE